jgi:hypothetical protein
MAKITPNTKVAYAVVDRVDGSNPLLLCAPRISAEEQLDAMAQRVTTRIWNELNDLAPQIGRDDAQKIVALTEAAFREAVSAQSVGALDAMVKEYL